MTGNRPVPPESIWQLEQARNGMITASEKGVRLHSAYNPEREAAGAVNRDEIFQKSSVVFYGFGLGYHVIEWAKLKKQNIRLIIIEPDIKYFYAAMAVLDWTLVFELENLILAVGAPAESILPLIENTSGINIGQTGVSDAIYFDIPSFTAHANTYFDTVRSIIKRNQRKNEINAATLKKFGRRWCRNSVKNLEQLEIRGFISALSGKAKALPFLVIGAGPSLEKILPYIQELKKRTVIICVETALHTLLRQNVEPDFVILTDPQFWAYRHITALSAPESILITEISAYPAVFRFSCSNILLCGSQFPIGQYTEKQLEIKSGDLGTGGSVASCAWNFAYFCGAGTIYTAGLDFAFPGGQTHIKGSSAEQTYHTLSNRLKASDTFTVSSLYNANAVTAKDFTGSPVITDSRMKMFSWWFESRLAGCSDVQTFTLCPQGLATPGIKVADVTELLSKPEDLIKKQKEAFIMTARSIKSELTQNQKTKLAELQKDFSSKETIPEAFNSQFPFLKEYF